jgi:plastocyanin
VIDQGGTVTFHTFGVHQIAIYDDGTEDEDINTSLTLPPPPSCPPVPLIDDPNNRLAVLGAQECAGGPTTLTYTFKEPGRYLVICDFLLHFTEADMYGYVVVRPR